MCNRTYFSRLRNSAAVKRLVPSPLFHSSLLPDDFIFPWIMCSLKQFSTILVTLSDFNKQTPLFLNHLQYMCPCMARPYQICLFMILGVKQKTEHIIQQKWSLNSLANQVLRLHKYISLPSKPGPAKRAGRLMFEGKYIKHSDARTTLTRSSYHRWDGCTPCPDCRWGLFWSNSFEHRLSPTACKLGFFHFWHFLHLAFLGCFYALFVFDIWLLRCFRELQPAARFSLSTSQPLSSLAFSRWWPIVTSHDHLWKPHIWVIYVIYMTYMTYMTYISYICHIRRLWLLLDCLEGSPAPADLFKDAPHRWSARWQWWWIYECDRSRILVTHSANRKQ